MIPFIDLSYQHRQVESEIRSTVEEVVRSGHYILGPTVEAFEGEMARWHGMNHAVGVASGTDALQISLKAAGVSEGDEVITSPFTFVATAEVLLHLGARPVFVDIREDTFNIDPSLVEAGLTGKTRAILPVHLYGLAADMVGINELASRRGLKVIEDCAQATGAKAGDRLVGTLGDAGAFSFFPTKNLGCFGDGGMILTNDDKLAEQVMMLRGHGASARDQYEIAGFNSRLDALQAAVLTVKLRRLEEWNELRRRNAALYHEHLEGLSELRLPVEPAGYYHVYNQFTIQTSRREELRRHLDQQGIQTMIYYPRSLHEQPLFASLGYGPGDFPVTEKVQAQVLSLPVYPGLKEEDAVAVAAAVRDFFG